MRRRWLIMLGLLLALLAGQARADYCTMNATGIDFGSVSSITSSDVTANSANWSVTCTWTNILTGLLTPNVTVCLYLGAGSNSPANVTAPRQLGNGAVKVNYNLYTDASYAAAKIWGGWSGTTPSGTTPIIFSMQKTGGVGSLNQPISIYGKLSADATLAATSVGDTDLNVTSDFGAGSAIMQYFFFLTGTPACTLGPVVAIPFQVSARVINDCNFSIGNLSFPDSGFLSGTLRSTSNVSVRCSKNTAYRISLSKGANGTVTTARKMKKTSGAETVSYQLSNTLDGTTWGDGNDGSLVVTGTGNGSSASLTVFGRVPAQSTPSPGDYKDTVTATVQF